MPNRFRGPIAALLAAGLALSACHRTDQGAALSGDDSPVAAAQTSIRLLRKADLAGFWRHALPPADYAALRDDWRQPGAWPAWAPERRDRLDAILRQLRAPDARSTLTAYWLPRLARARQDYGDQLPLLAGIGRALLVQDLAAHTVLDAAQQRDVDAMLDALAPWAAQAPWFDPARAQQAIGVAVDGARALGLDSVAQWRGLDFPLAMRKGGTAFATLYRLLAIYGLSVERTLASTRVSPMERHGDHATVRIDYTLRGTPLVAHARMVRIDHRWYALGMLEAAHRYHAQARTLPGSPGRHGKP